MTIKDKRYPRNWERISKLAIERAHNRCQDCGIEGGIIGKHKSRVGKQAFSIVSEAELVALKEVADRQEQSERRQLTREQLDDFSFRLMFAEVVKDDPSWTVIVDPDERRGYYQEGSYYPCPDDDDYDSDYARAARELKALGLTRIILQNHHIDQNPSNCDESNLVTLCQFCHGAKHEKPKTSRARSRKAVSR